MSETSESRAMAAAAAGQCRAVWARGPVSGTPGGAAVARHVEYAAGRGVPWGISESAYNARDRNQTYQYRGFGVPELASAHRRRFPRSLHGAPFLLPTEHASVRRQLDAWFESPTLKRDIRIFGSPTVRIWSDVQRSWVTYAVSVVDIDPAFYSGSGAQRTPSETNALLGVTRGWLDSRYRNTLAKRQTWKAGQNGLTLVANALEFSATGGTLGTSYCAATPNSTGVRSGSVRSTSSSPYKGSAGWCLDQPAWFA